MHVIPGPHAASPSSSTLLTLTLSFQSIQPSTVILWSARSAAHIGQFLRDLKPPEHFASPSYHHRNTVTEKVTACVSDKWVNRPLSQHMTTGAESSNSQMHLWSTAGYIQQTSSVRHNQELYRENPAVLHPWKITAKKQAAMVTEHCFNPSIFKRFFFSVKYFSRGSQAMAKLEDCL